MLRRQVCSLRSFVDWLVATNSRLITFLYKQRTQSLKVSYSGTPEAFEVFARRIYKISLFSKCSNQFPTSGKVICFSVVQIVYPVSLRRLIKSAERKPANHNKTSRGKLSKRDWIIVSKRTTWKQRREILASESGLQLIEVTTPPVNNQLSWQGAVRSRSYFCVQQEFDCPSSYKEGTSKVSAFRKSQEPNWFN